MKEIAIMVLPLAIKFVGWLLDKGRADKETKEKFIAFVEKMQGQESGSMKSRNSYEEQLKRLKNDSEQSETPK